MSNEVLKKLFLGLSFSMLLGLLVYQSQYHFQWIHTLIRPENSLGENLTFLLFFGSALGILLQIRKRTEAKEGILLLPLFIWFLLSGLEEISFGQSLFFKDEVLLKSINTQAFYRI